VCLNGPAARLAAPGDQVIVIAYADMTPEEAQAHRPRVVLVDEDNDPKEVMELDTDERVPEGENTVEGDVLIA
jgi:aspartate 1-decarboxylase